MGWYKFAVDGSNLVDISAPIFPVGGGIILGPIFSDIGIVIEGFYNIVPFKGRYISINIGLIDCP